MEKISRDFPSVELEAFIELQNFNDQAQTPTKQQNPSVRIQIDWAHSHFFKTSVRQRQQPAASPGTGLDEHIMAQSQPISSPKADSNPQQKNIAKLIKYLKEEYHIFQRV
jgi:hypothetical protein